MTEIRYLPPESLETFALIAANAYPRFGWYAPEKRETLIEHLLELQADDPTTHIYGLFRQGELLGGMRLHDFRMNLFGTWTPAGGVGMVAVDLLHKKEHVAKELLTFFLTHYRAQGAPLALLYPFRPDFYYAMGFGYGSKKNRYCVLPSALSPAGNRANLCVLTKADIPALLDCYQRYANVTHGMIARTRRDFERLFKAPATRVIGVLEGTALTGYLVFNFQSACEENFTLNDLQVLEWVYTQPAALRALLAFLATQHDQVNRIIIDTLDDNLHYLFRDPRDGATPFIPSVYHQSNVQGVGLMYRVIDVPRLFEALAERDFGGQTCRMALELRDTFLPENAGRYVIQFTKGRGQLAKGAAEVTVSMDVAEFSALVLGCVTFAQLHMYGLATLSDVTYLQVIDRLFAAQNKPICMTAF